MTKFIFLPIIALAMFITTSCSDEPWYDDSDTTGLSSRADGDETVSNSFYRNHAIGYSYNALEGEYCNPSDVRCQIINKKVLEQAQKEMRITLLRTNKRNELKYNHYVYTSVVNYAQNTNVAGSVGGNVLLFNGSIQKACSIFEDGTIDTYILHDEMTLPMLEYSILTGNNLKKAIKSYPNILTSSFRAAINKLEKNINDIKALDDFIQTYGTHVVTYVSLGAKLSVDVQVETRKFNTQLNDTMVASVALGTLFQTSLGKSKESQEYGILKNNHCNINVMGGDVSILDSYISMMLFDASSTDGSELSRWMESIVLDNTNMARSNVEVFEMRVAPIYDFIDDEQVAALVEARIKGDAASLQKRLGNRNFINTTMEAHPQTASCKVLYGEPVDKEYKTYEMKEPLVVDIIAANRHVATICREPVPEISETGDVFVAYPIYEGRIKKSEGLCIYNGNVYSVDWQYDHFNVKMTGQSNSDSIYLNAGILSVTKQEGVDYQQSHAMLGAERPGGVTIEGEAAGDIVPTRKYLGDFYLADSYDEIIGYSTGLEDPIFDWVCTEGMKFDNLPGWSWSEGSWDNYYEYYDMELPRSRMKRNEDYVYKYNPNEITFIK